MAGDLFFGGATGTRAALEDDLATLNAISGARRTDVIEGLAPYQAREHAAHATKMELENLQNQRFMELMQKAANDPQAMGGAGGQPGQAPSMRGQLNYLANLATKAGLVNKGVELGKAAALIGSREASQMANEARARVQYLTGVQKDAELTGQLLGDVKDQDSWDRANALYSFQTGRPSPFTGMQYSQALVEALQRQAISAKDRAAQEQRRVRDAALQRYREERLDQFDEEAAQREERLELEAERERRLAKGGGGRAITSPSKNETDQAKLTLNKNFPNLSDADRKDAAFTIASEARAIRRANPGIDPATAIQQAYINMVNSGDLESTEGLTVAGYNTGVMKKDSYIRGKRPETAQPVPTAKGDLVEGRYYINPAGMVAKWTGKGFEPVRYQRGIPPASGRPRPSPGIDPSLIDPEDDVETGDPDNEED